MADREVQSGDSSKGGTVSADHADDASIEPTVAGGADAEDGSTGTCAGDLPALGEEPREAGDHHGKRRAKSSETPRPPGARLGIMVRTISTRAISQSCEINQQERHLANLSVFHIQPSDA